MTIARRIRSRPLPALAAAGTPGAAAYDEDGRMAEGRLLSSGSQRLGKLINHPTSEEVP